MDGREKEDGSKRRGEREGEDGRKTDERREKEDASQSIEERKRRYEIEEGREKMEWLVERKRMEARGEKIESGAKRGSGVERGNGMAGREK